MDHSDHEGVTFDFVICVKTHHNHITMNDLTYNEVWKYQVGLQG